MPRVARFPQARPGRRPHGRLAGAAIVGAVISLLAWPASGPTGHVLDLVSDDGAAAIGLEPTASQRPSASTEEASAQPAGPSPTPEPTPALATIDIAPKLGYGENPGPPVPPVDSLEGYVWPLAHPRLTLPFGPTPWGTRLVDGETFHDGVDLATFCGDRIMAAHAGTVLAAGRRYDDFMGWVGDLGPYLARLDAKQLWMTLPIVVVIDDGNGYRSMYAHFGRVVVKPGQHVKAGQLIGYEGATGRASGCHLHFGLFSPWERATFAILPDVAKRMKLPKAETARVDPLPILPPKPGVNAPATPKPSPRAPASPASTTSPKPTP
jgi:murein DD-endopeptidase MepM/ murein hydrolase activator NlpD